jgi:hypothetical protein
MKPGRRVVRVIGDEGTVEWERLSPQSMVVIESPEGEAYFTGILDENGDPLYRFPEKVPMGFQAPRAMTEEEYAAWRYGQDGCHG